MSAGPDTLTTCAAEDGRILQLNTEYLAGVGGPCSSYYNEWEPLSVYKEGDLEDLREIAENVQEDRDSTCRASTPSTPSASSTASASSTPSTPTSDTVHVSSIMCITAAAAILVMYILI